MKIAHLIQQLFTNIGGLQVCLHNICQRHSHTGIDVHVFCCDAKAQSISTDYKVNNFFNFRAITQLYPLTKFLIAAYVSQLQKKYKFDIWQIYGGYPYGAFLADFFQTNKIPCVLRCSGDDIQINEELGYGVRRNPKVNRIISKNYKKYPAVVAITETVRQEYLKLRVPAERIRLIPNGVDIGRLQGISKQGIRKKLGISPDSTLILTVGRNHPKKGYTLIPDILNMVLNRGIDAYWIIIGRQSSEMKEEIKSRSLSDRIILVEEIENTGSSYDLPPDELIHYYHGADLFAMTSLLETFGIVLIEAVAAGLPVVCFNAPGIRDVMTPDCGIICPLNDIKAFADAIFRLVKREEKPDLTERCYSYAERFSWDIISDKYLELYSYLLNQNELKPV